MTVTKTAFRLVQEIRLEDGSYQYSLLYYWKSGLKSTVTNIAFIYFIYVRAEDEHFDRAQFYIWKSGLKRTVTIQP